ncbi:unnamed protein product [Pleuronectes platessa]|uniref:Uncharacterized protein n=1 Tax=Pleuronectes platessa TaxID=8262 RepID=A0A9N7V4J5_PLEPL|nr:unnamed protein product [Pleuronectes platessa]
MEPVFHAQHSCSRWRWGKCTLQGGNSAREPRWVRAAGPLPRGTRDQMGPDTPFNAASLSVNVSASRHTDILFERDRGKTNAKSLEWHGYWETHRVPRAQSSGQQTLASPLSLDPRSQGAQKLPGAAK